MTRGNGKQFQKSVIYQVYLRTFTAEGTLKAAEKMIPHIADLGVDIIYLSVCNKEDPSTEGQSTRQLASGMNNSKNPYRIMDYYDVDEEYGTLQDMKDFIETAHVYGLKVLVDLVYLHCGAGAVFLQDHPEYVIRDEAGNIKLSGIWPFPRLQYDEPALREYLWENMEFYIRDMKADGFRCDVGDAIPLDFWREGVRRIKEINPDVIMLNEGSDPSYLDVFDINYNLEMVRGMNNVFVNPDNALKPQTHASCPYSEYHTLPEVKAALTEIYANLPEGTYTLCHAENHDTVSDMVDERLEVHLGSDAMEAILVLVFTMKGVPMIYGGCEVADLAPKCMFWNRFCPGVHVVQWENALTQMGRERLAWVKKLISLHREHNAVSEGDFAWIPHDCEDSVICFKRASKDACLTVMVNVTAAEQVVHAPEMNRGEILFLNHASITEQSFVLAPYGVIVSEA